MLDMQTKKTIKEVMETKSNEVKIIISKTLAIENKYINRRKERRSAVEEIIDMVKNEVK
jgi:hypothetical protein